MSVKVHHGDSRDVLRTIADCSIDSVVCDPPYALVSIAKRFGADNAAPVKVKARPGQGGSPYLRSAAGFMGKRWDTGETAFDPDFWREVWRVMKPGAHLAAFGGTRSYHRLACAIEDAGFEIRDMVSWNFGSGFPKSHDVSKGIDKAGVWNAEFDDVRAWLRAKVKAKGLKHAEIDRAIGNENSHMASHFLGTSQPMLPTWDQWVVIKKLLGVDEDIDRPPKCIGYERAIIGHRKVNAGLAFTSDGPTELPITAPATDEAAQWEGWGTALKPAFEPICLARKPLSEKTIAANVLRWGTGALNIDASRVGTELLPEMRAGQARIGTFERADMVTPERVGRWPANVCHDGSEEVVGAFPIADSTRASGNPNKPTLTGNGDGSFGLGRDRGRTFVDHADTGSAARFFYTAKADAEDRLGSKHPTVKPVDLMRWLCTLITPPAGTILDPFAGTGTTGLAAMGAGFGAVLIEREAEYVADIERRLAWAKGEGRLTAQETTRRATPSDHGPLFAMAAE